MKPIILTDVVTGVQIVQDSESSVCLYIPRNHQIVDEVEFKAAYARLIEALKLRGRKVGGNDVAKHLIT